MIIVTLSEKAIKTYGIVSVDKLLFTNLLTRSVFEVIT